MYYFGKVEMPRCNFEKHCNEILNIIHYITLHDEFSNCYTSRQNSMVNLKMHFFSFLKTNNFYVTDTNKKIKAICWDIFPIKNVIEIVVFLQNIPASISLHFKHKIVLSKMFSLDIIHIYHRLWSLHFYLILFLFDVLRQVSERSLY